MEDLERREAEIEQKEVNTFISFGYQAREPPSYRARLNVSPRLRDSVPMPISESRNLGKIFQQISVLIDVIVSLQGELRKRADEEIAKRESEFKEMLDQMERDYSQKEQVSRVFYTCSFLPC